MEKRLETMFKFDISGAIYCSLFIMLVLAVLAIIVGILAKRQDPTKESKGLLFLTEWAVDKLSNWVEKTMGQGFENFTGFFLALAAYLFLAFVWSVTGLPSLVDYLAIPLSLALVMFILIHFTAIRYQKLGYFHRYVDPIAVFLPVNLITMWSPIISTTLRLFGNALSGFIIIGIVSWAFQTLSNTIFPALGSAGGLIFGPIPIGILNLYFGLFSAYIQTLVFCSLNAIWISQERPFNAQPMGIESQAIRGVEE